MMIGARGDAENVACLVFGRMLLGSRRCRLRCLWLCSWACFWVYFRPCSLSGFRLAAGRSGPRWLKPLEPSVTSHRLEDAHKTMVDIGLVLPTDKAFDPVPFVQAFAQTGLSVSANARQNHPGVSAAFDPDVLQRLRAVVLLNASDAQLVVMYRRASSWLLDQPAPWTFHREPLPTALLNVDDGRALALWTSEVVRALIYTSRSSGASALSQGAPRWSSVIAPLRKSSTPSSVSATSASPATRPSTANKPLTSGHLKPVWAYADGIAGWAPDGLNNETLYGVRLGAGIVGGQI